MKPLLIAMLAFSLTGCAGPAGQKFMESFGQGLEQQAQYRQTRPTYTPMEIKRTDNQCFQSCTQAGYQYGLCQSKCTY